MSKNKLRDEIRHQINNWNRKFPIDFWWRRKYSIPYGSEQHRNANLIDMFYDYEEEKIMNEVIEKFSKEEDDSEVVTDSNSGVGKKMTKQELDDAFDNIDLNEFNKK
jgi:hypothetical protein